MTALARTSDPLSSHIAASNVDTEKQRNLVLSALRRIEKPVTAKELSKISKIDYYLIQRRVSDLVKLGLIRRGEMVKDIFTGRSSTLLELI